MKVITADQIRATLTVGALIPAIEQAMKEVSAGDALHPPRFAVPINEKGRMALMYGALREPRRHGLKVLSLYPDAPKMGLSSHQGFVVVFDSDTGVPLIAADADALTALRTSAASMLSIRALARPDPKVFAVFGAGEQAEWHIRGALECFAPTEIRLWSRRPEQALHLAAHFPEAAAILRCVPTLEVAAGGADVLITATAARTAFFPGALLEPGQHLILVGASLADAREVDDEAVARVRMFTDSLESSSRESGEIIDARTAGAIPEDYAVTEIGAVLSDPSLFVRGDGEITAYKSHGLIVQDLAAAVLAGERVG
ncbi:ornithine cyclodeaminase family protein [Chachezhania sediminis]|uniref:ornithine cyclodeaminase family protein n=1 Tax=Chachezhania sediminis TaxID=2599291 RepID=UPI00131C07E6|nr:ornithine cyclodeaminase family protein [Chachezhania sediminis]